jgi:hypothetical protein
MRRKLGRERHREDVEGLSGSQGDDVLIGDEDANRLIAYSGRDVLRGGGGPDELIGWGDGDELDAGAGRDRVQAGALDRPLLVDGHVDRLDCHSRAPAIDADAFDLLHTCAPSVRVRPVGRVRAGRRLVLRARCPAESTVPCKGTLWVHLLRGRRISRAVRFGPIEPGGRRTATVRLRNFPRTAMCLYATTRARRGDGFRSVTATRSVFACVPRR